MAISSIRQNQFFSGKVNYTKTKLESPVYNTAKKTDNNMSCNNIITNETFVNPRINMLSFKAKNIKNAPGEYIKNKLKKAQEFEEKISDICVSEKSLKRKKGIYYTNEGNLFNGYTIVSVKKKDNGTVMKLYNKYKNGYPKAQLMTVFDRDGKLNEFWIGAYSNIRAVNNQYDIRMKEWNKDKDKIINLISTEVYPKVKQEDIIDLTPDLMKKLKFDIDF